MVGERLTHALVKGVSDFFEEDTVEARVQSSEPIEIIESLCNSYRLLPS